MNDLPLPTEASYLADRLDKLEAKPFIPPPEKQIHEIVYRLEFTNQYAYEPLYVPIFVHYTKSKASLKVVKIFACIPSQEDIVKGVDKDKLERDLNNDFKIGRLL